MSDSENARTDDADRRSDRAAASSAGRGLVAKSLKVASQAIGGATEDVTKAATRAVGQTHLGVCGFIGVFVGLVPFIRTWVQGLLTALLVSAAGLVALFGAVVLVSKLFARLRSLGAKVLWNSAGWLVAIALAGVLVVAGVFGPGRPGHLLPAASAASEYREACLDYGAVQSQPARPDDGMTLHMTYHISRSSAVLAGLGAGLYDNQGNDHSNGRYDRNAFPVMAGTHAYSRPVVIPSHLAAGRYDLDAEVWPPNHVGQNEFNTWTDATCGYMTVP